VTSAFPVHAFTLLLFVAQDVGAAAGGIMFMPNFLKMRSRLEREDTDRQHGDLTTLILLALKIISTVWLH
jgi:hypothetical protein